MSRVFCFTGEELALSHLWDTEGTFLIKAKVRDIYNEESDCENYQVSVEEKSRSITSKLHLFRQQILKYIFIILQQITLAKK